MLADVTSTNIGVWRLENRIHPGRVPPALFSRTRHKNRIGVKTRNGEYSVNGIRLLSSNEPYCSADGCRSAVRKPLYQSGANRRGLTFYTEVRLNLRKLQSEYLLDLADVVVAVKDERGNVKLHQLSIAVKS